MKFLRGARPSKAHKLQAQRPFIFRGTLPASVINTGGTPMQMDGNDTLGDCTCACLGNILDVVKRIMSYSGGAIPDANVIAWAKSHGFQDGAEIIDVTNALATDPMIDAGGNACLIGANAGVDYTDTKSVCGALASNYALDLGVDAQPLEDCGAGNSPVVVMPVLTKRYGNLDHSIPAFDYGAAGELATAYHNAYNVPVSLGSVGDSEPSIGLETWASLVITPIRSFEQFVGEAHVIESFPAPSPFGPTPPKPPTPPSPCPWLRPAVCFLRDGANLLQKHFGHLMAIAIVLLAVSSASAARYCPSCQGGPCPTCHLAKAIPPSATLGDPTPDQIQQVITDLASLETADQANVAAKAVVVQDTAALTAAQTTLATDTASQATAEAGEQAAIAQLQADVQNLSADQLNALKAKLGPSKAAKLAALPRREVAPVAASVSATITAKMSVSRERGRFARLRIRKGW